eukprot:3092847-Alexandrium_andersonii.AAC.1
MGGGGGMRSSPPCLLGHGRGRCLRCCLVSIVGCLRGAGVLCSLRSVLNVRLRVGELALSLRAGSALEGGAPQHCTRGHC